MTISSEVKRGSDCSLTDGVINRVLALGNTSLTVGGGFMVYANGAALVLTADYTVNHLVASSTVTFVNPVWDVDYITVVYVLSGASVGTGKYCSSTDIYNKTGLSTVEVSSAIVEELILDAEAELEGVTGKFFTNANAITENISIKDKDVVGNYSTTLQLRNYPVQSITSFVLTDIDGNAVSTLANLTAVQIAAGTINTTDYWLTTSHDTINNTFPPSGFVALKTQTMSKQFNKAVVSYTYGYASVPQMIRNLAVCLTGIRVWLAFMGGNYNRIQSYSIPEQSVQKGDFYNRCQMNVQLLTDEAERLYDRIGRRSRTVFFASGETR